MLGLGIQEILIILVVALVVIGPKKLPELAKGLGRAVREFKRATDDIKHNFDIDEDLDIPASINSVHSAKQQDTPEPEKNNQGKIIESDDLKSNGG